MAKILKLTGGSLVLTLALTTMAMTQTTWSCQSKDDQCSATYGKYKLYAQDNGNATYVSIAYQKYESHALEQVITIADGQTLREVWYLIDKDGSRSDADKDHEILFPSVWTAFTSLPERLAVRFRRREK